MPWQELPDPTAEEIATFRRAKRSRFLIDESLGSGTIEFFQYYRLNAVDVWQVGLNGHDDNAVFAFAWRHRRILLTHDEDFWDDRHFPEHRNPGLVILPGANGNQTDMILGLVWMLLKERRAPKNAIDVQAVVADEEVSALRQLFS
jgi:predicted nuclease of predicted toxin-antitoxin system